MLPTNRLRPGSLLSLESADTTVQTSRYILPVPRMDARRDRRHRHLYRVTSFTAPHPPQIKRLRGAAAMDAYILEARRRAWFD